MNVNSCVEKIAVDDVTDRKKLQQNSCLQSRTLMLDNYLVYHPILLEKYTLSLKDSNNVKEETE